MNTLAFDEDVAVAADLPAPLHRPLVLRLHHHLRIRTGISTATSTPTSGGGTGTPPHPYASTPYAQESRVPPSPARPVINGTTLHKHRGVASGYHVPLRG